MVFKSRKETTPLYSAYKLHDETIMHLFHDCLTVYHLSVIPTNCLSVFDHFVGLALNGLKMCGINTNLSY